jgi:hypothetical protein
MDLLHITPELSLVPPASPGKSLLKYAFDHDRLSYDCLNTPPVVLPFTSFASCPIRLTLVSALVSLSLSSRAYESKTYRGELQPNSGGE